MPSIDLKDQYFGCEIEMTGLTRQQAAEAVASLFGTNAVHIPVLPAPMIRGK